MEPDLDARAAIHAALAEPHRLAIVDELTISDRSPTELGAALGMPTNLLAHHLDVLEAAGLIERFTSAGDRRRRYVRLIRTPFAELVPRTLPSPHTALFVCSQNSARSQLAAALWARTEGHRAMSAGTHPADAVHPGAVAAATRAGLDLHDAAPRLLDDSYSADIAITVCDRAHEELAPPTNWLHWSIPDPVNDGTDAAFDAVVAELEARINTLTSGEPMSENTDTLDKPAVLFLCVHNAGRSQMAAGWLRHLAGDRIDVFSGGSAPGDSTNAAAIEAMSEVGIDIATEYPKPWTDEIARAADVIITMGCGDACPIFPGKRYEDWELTDPAGQPIEIVREVRDDIRNRVEQLVAGLEPATT